MRILLVPVIVILLIQGDYFKALMVFIAAGVTDGLDGMLARLLNQKTVLGAYLDPLADKALILSTFVTLSVLGFIPGWLSVIVISRDCIILVGIAILSLMDIALDIRPTFISKLTTGLQLLTILLALAFKSLSIDFNAHVLDDVVYLLTAAFTIASGFGYIIIGLRMINHTVPERKS